MAGSHLPSDFLAPIPITAGVTTIASAGQHLALAPRRFGPRGGQQARGATAKSGCVGVASKFSAAGLPGPSGLRPHPLKTVYVLLVGYS